MTIVYTTTLCSTTTQISSVFVYVTGNFSVNVSEQWEVFLFCAGY